MKEVNCRELYRLPITIDLMEDLYKLGKAAGKRLAILQHIFNDENMPKYLRLQWALKYNEEWFESVADIMAAIREKANLKDEVHVFTYDLSNKELVVLDFLKADHDRLCKINNYFVRVNYTK